MAKARTTWFGVLVDFDHSEITQVGNIINSGSTTVGLITATLASFGITGPAAVISGIVTALLGVGAASLSTCNNRQNGVVIFVLWVGLPWCVGK